MKVKNLAKFRLLVAAGFVISSLVLGGFTFAHAQEDTTTDDTSETTTEEDKKQSREERLAKRKEALEARLTFAQQARLKTRCKPAQGLLKSAEVRIKGVETRRMNAYEKLVDRLSELSTKLQGEGLDTTELNAQITELEAEIAAFKEQITEYKQAISDIAAMDCASDPGAFKASLDAARTARGEAVEAAKEIHSYVLETIKKTLQELKSQLQTEASDEEEADGQE